MKLSSFKFSPFWACLFGLSISNKAYCAADIKSNTTRQIAKTVAPGQNKGKNVSDKKNQLKKKNVAISTNSGSVKADKKIVKGKKETSIDNKNEGEVKKAVSSEKNNNENNASKVLDEKVVSLKDTAKNDDKNVLTEPAKSVDSSIETKSEVAVEKTEQKKNEVKNIAVSDAKSGKKERRRKKSDFKKVVEVDKNHEKENLKVKDSKNSDTLSKRKSEIADDEIISNDSTVEENTDTPGISADEYFKFLSSSVDNFYGNNVQHSDIVSKLSGKNKECFNAIYTVYDVNGNHKFKKNDIQFKNQLIRRIDLREKVNLPFFRSNKEITKYIINGISEGKLVAFTDSFLTQTLTKDLLKEQLLMPKDIEASVDDDNAQELFFDAHDISTLEINSNWIYDKNNSAFSEDPTILKLIIPAEKFSDTTKIQRVVCCIRYADVLKFLKSIPEASWIDESNEAVVLPMGEAFSMGLLDSSITFIGNRDCNNGDVVDRWGSKEGDMSFASRKAEDFRYKFEGSLDSI